MSERREEKGEIEIRYLDESGFCLQPYILYAWQEKGETIGIESQKSQRFNEECEGIPHAFITIPVRPERLTGEVEILRDRIDSGTGEFSPFDVFDNNASIGGNGSLRQVVFDPQKLMFWVAAGEVPIPENPFTCFSLGEMLGLPGAESCPSPAIE